MNARDAVLECFDHHPGRALAVGDVRAWIEERYPGRWKDIGTTLADLVIGGNDSSKYTREEQFLERAGRGVYRVARAPAVADRAPEPAVIRPARPSPPAVAATAVDALLVHADPDTRTALALHAHLLTAGLTPWCAARDLIPGDPWDRAIPAALDRARLLVALIGPSWPAPGDPGGDWYAHEQIALAIDHARHRDPPMALVPVWLDGVAARQIPLGLRRLTEIRAASTDIPSIAYGIQRALSALAGQPPPPPRPDPIALRARLAELFPSRDDTAMLLDDAGFDTARFDLDGGALNRWHKALREVQKHTGGLDRLIAVVRRHGYTL